MTKQVVIRGSEHSPEFTPEPSPTIKAWLGDHSYQAKKETLGVHSTQNGLCPGNFIGMVWIGEGDSRVVLRVDSKLARMDYIRMYCECAADPKVSDNLYCLHLEKGDLIDAPDSKDFSLLIAVAYLRELKTLCSRHLRRHFLRERQNFAGKMKGKILAGENLRRNVLRGRLDRVYCEYQSVSDDILENRILRTALERAARYVASNNTSKNIQKKLPRMQEWIRLCRSHLCGVSIARIRPHDFAAARKRGVFAHYARPLQLAKAVLRQLGFNPQTELNKSTKTPPYAINSEELFERFAELKLREHFRQKGLELVARGKFNSEKGDSFPVNVKPDFYVRPSDNGSAQIIDAKYKRVIPRNDKPDEGDIYQVIAYSRHQKLLEEIGDGNAAPLVALIYPSLDGDENIDTPWKTTNAFHTTLHVYKLLCPRANTINNKTESAAKD